MTATDDMFFDEEIDSGYECSQGHPLRLVAEGYAICRDETGLYWWAWRMTPPPLATCTEWGPYKTQRGGAPNGHRWVSAACRSRERALDYIRRDIEAHRNLPLDEAAERQRLMPV